MFGIIPRRDKLNAKATQVNIYLENECNRTIICFIDNSNINPRYNWNKSDAHLSKSETNGVIENMLFPLSNLDYWHETQVSMNNNIFSIIGNSKKKSQVQLGKKARQNHKRLHK